MFLDYIQSKYEMLGAVGTRRRPQSLFYYRLHKPQELDSLM
jgi:hypothetical protein